MHSKKIKTLFIIAGANGSGKTTLAKELLPAYSIDFINADELAKQINPDNIEAVRINAGKLTLKKIDEMLNSGNSFALETTLSGNYLVKFIHQAKGQDYNIVLIYSFLKSPETCIDRIRFRVEKGGHHVPDNDVIRRYYRSLKNFWYKYKDIADEWSVFYNGLEKYMPVMEGDSEGIEIFNEELYNLFMENINNA